MNPKSKGYDNMGRGSPKGWDGPRKSRSNGMDQGSPK